METFKNWLDSLEFDFVKTRYYWASVSALIVLASWLGVGLYGLNWGTDFTGGTEIHLQFEQDIAIEDVREALARLGLTDEAVQATGAAEARQFRISIQDPEFGMEELSKTVRERLTTAFGPDWIEDIDVTAEVGARFSVAYAGENVTPQAVEAALAGVDGVRAQSGRDPNVMVVTVPGLSHLVQDRIAEVLGGSKFEVLSIEAVGPKVGADLRRQGLVAIVASLGLVLIYIAFRFDLAFAPGAILALVHDVSVTAGLFVLLQLEFSVPMIGALLTIVGYSLNDTIVIYDRIRENKDRYRRSDLTTLINTSINETLSRTLTTNFTVTLSVFAFLFFGGPVIRNFAIAMLCGVVFGTYSTIFVASPMIIVMEDVKPWLSRFVAMPTLSGGAEDTPEAGDAPGEMTESEKRRRERAEAEKKQTPGV